MSYNRNSPRGICHFISRPGGCRRGDNCQFSHDSAASSSGRGRGGRGNRGGGDRGGYIFGNSSRGGTSIRPRRHDWSTSLSGYDSLNPTTLANTIDGGFKVVEAGDSDATQALIKDLGSEKGLQWIVRVFESNFQLDPDGYSTLGFFEHCVPFLRLISHEQILMSLVLEKEVGTIYNVLYGGSKRRGILCFERISAVLSVAMADTARRSQCEEAIFALSATLFSVINLNQDAVIQKEYKTITQTLSQCLNSFASDRLQSFALRSASSYIRKIKERLGMGAAIPDATYNAPITMFPEFQLNVDPPGDLSLKGPRHDNDHASIEDISILPTTDEIKGDRAEYLPLKSKNVPHHKTGIHRLLDSQFRLLREDTSGQLRDAVCALVERWEFLVRGKDKNVKRKLLRQIDAKISIFDRVKVSELRFDRRKGMVVDVTFAQPARVEGMKPKDRIDWWEKDSRDLQIGSLVALVDDTRETSFLLVTDRTVVRPRREDESAEHYRNRGVVDLASNENRALVTLALVNPTSELDQARIMALVQQSSSECAAVLVEFPGLLFASFEPILKCLQSLHKQPNLPFTDWLAPTVNSNFIKHNGLVQVPPPLYLSKTPGLSLDLACITHDKHPLRFSLQRPVTVEELEQHTTLDRGQCESLISSLSNELALVQGPPGTGKSYVGLQLVKILLANRDKLKLGPLVCVCYTNHALDQFLEHLLDAGATSIIRLGSRSKSERLANLTLFNVRSGVIKTRIESKNIWECNQAIEEIQDDLRELLERCSRGCSPTDIAFHLQQLAFQTGDKTHDILFAGAKDLKSSHDAGGWKTVGNRTRADIFRTWSQGRNLPGRQTNQSPLQLLQNTDRTIEQLLRNTEDVWGMTQRERQTLRSYWEECINDSRRQKLRVLVEEFTKQTAQLQAQYKEGDKRCLEQAHVIGVTTTGLASNSELLRSLPAKVLVCEEAAEVLEAHLISAMLPSVEHAILIGDHLQLRAQISRYELSMESEQGKKYGLDESLFERLANETFDGAKMPIAKLDVQRRMHPSIASLVRDTLYPQLRDHATTHLYPEIMGMRRRLFWLDHQNREDSSAQDGPMQTSKTNEWEAEMVVSLVKHLARQGVYHGKEDIAVITPYLGQLRKLRQKFQTTFDLVIGDKDLENILDDEEEEAQLPIKKPLQKQEVRKGRLIDGIRLATVDNFQGEEAKIIVVSLVRSNEEHKCGFLKTSNRINVLLSRAQHGMYIIGDSQTSIGVPMWNKVVRMLEANDNIGPTFELQCPRHPTTPIHVASPEDFIRLAPEGGCSERCGLRLDCGHTCLVKCHSNALHQAVKCLENCIKSFVHCDHPCPKRCWEDCGNCRVPITSAITLPCGHSPSHLDCWETVDLSKVKCRQKVVRQLPCGHQANVQCYIDISTYQCNSKCDSALPCGHNCNRKCRDCTKKDKETPEATVVDHGKCVMPCGRTSQTCSHACKRPCHPDEACGPCQQPCDVRCVHSRCPNKCSEPCGCCVELCTWGCPHSKCHMPCAVPCDRLPCSVRCTKMLECGHLCPSICGEVCPGSEFCKECATAANSRILDQVVDFILYTTYRDHEDLEEDPIVLLSCGHFYTMSTLDGHMDLRSAYVMEDGKILEPKNFDRMELKSCPECRAPLRNIHRYNRVVKGAMLDQATKRFMQYAGALQTALQEKVEEREQKLEDMVNEFALLAGQTNTALGSKTQKIRDYRRQATAAYTEVSKFVTQVSETEQPYGKVQTMVLDARRRRGAVSKFELDNTVIQHGFELRGKALQLRIMWAILWNFKRLSPHLALEEYVNEWSRYILPQLMQVKDQCSDLLVDAEKANMVKQQIEARIYRAQFVSLELKHSPLGSNMPEEALAGVLAAERDSLAQCDLLIAGNPSAAYLTEDVEKARKLLRGGTFYSFVSSEEKKQIYVAMSREFSGTGHWYYCEQGHPFAVDRCGLPMELARCPECGSAVGGQHHIPTAGVRRADDFDAEFGRMNLGR